MTWSRKIGTFTMSRPLERCQDELEPETEPASLHIWNDSLFFALDLLQMQLVGVFS